jgi:hypothetical protein
VKVTRFRKALNNAEAHASTDVILGRYPQHTTGIARAAFRDGAEWARRYMLRGHTLMKVRRAP